MHGLGCSVRRDAIRQVFDPDRRQFDAAIPFESIAVLVDAGGGEQVRVGAQRGEMPMAHDRRSQVDRLGRPGALAPAPGHSNPEVIKGFDYGNPWEGATDGDDIIRR